jgi:hypothetical protein
MIVKVLGGIDVLSAFAFLMMVFGIGVPFQFILFCSGLLMIKGMFIFSGDVLSFIDIFSSALLTLTIFFTLPTALLWTPAFFLLAKGVVSFM